MSKSKTQKKFPGAYSEDGGPHPLPKERFSVYAKRVPGALFRRCLGNGPSFRAAWAKAALADTI